VSRPQRLELFLFIATFFAFAYFHQGGGWNQNSRFAEVRAMAEQGRFAVDDYLIYEVDPATGDLRRVPMRNAEFELDGKRKRLAWVDMVWTLFPVNEKPVEEGVTLEPMISLCASGDLGYVPHTGHFHPNKPPGTSFIALPSYWLLYQAERLLGIDPDRWWTVTVNSWITTVCSVGLLSALGCVLFFRLARDFAGGALWPAAAATLAFAFGTTFFPFGTILFDHNLTAVLLLAAFYFLRRGVGSSTWMLAGFCAGLAAITNYVAAVAIAFLGLYALLASRTPSGSTVIGAGPQASRRWYARWRPALFFSLGVIPPFLLICWYGWVNFGSPFKLANDFQNPLFKDPSGALGMFRLFQSSADVSHFGYVAGILTLSPYRGIFVLAPVLLLAGWGIFVWLREKTFVAEARLCLGIFGFFFLVNASFNGYHGGFSAGPRYLVPGLPFLALPLVVAFRRRPKLTSVLAALSIAQQTLLTATDGQNPLAVGGHARDDRREDFFNSLVADYAWPLFAHERAWPMLEILLGRHLEKERARLEAANATPDEIAAQLAETERELREAMVRGDASPFLLAAIEGPVSVNPIGIFEGLLEFRHFPPHSEQTRWASFNVGEFLWPRSRWSLLPLVLVSGTLSFLLLAGARREDCGAAGPPAA
jgi:hypothetical protein